MKLFPVLAVLGVVTALSLSSCDKKEAPKGAAVVVANQESAVKTVDNNIAYVEVDSLLTQYEYCIKEKAILEAKSKQYEAQIKAKMVQLQKATADFQQKVQSGAFTSQAQGEAVPFLVRLQQEGAKLQQEAQQKMLKAQEKFNKTLRDSVQSFLKDYNKDMHFDMILSKQGDNVLYANDKLDITKEVVNGMNKRYQSK